MNTTETLKQTESFRLYKSGNHFRVKCLLSNHYPSGRRIMDRDMRYLMELSTKPNGNGVSTFDMACTAEMGVGVYQKHDPTPKVNTPQSVLLEVHNYFTAIDAMQPNKNHGSEGERIRALVKSTIGKSTLC